MGGMPSSRPTGPSLPFAALRCLSGPSASSSSEISLLAAHPRIQSHSRDSWSRRSFRHDDSRSGTRLLHTPARLQPITPGLP